LLTVASSCFLSYLYLRGFSTISDVAEQLKIQLDPVFVTSFYEQQGGLRLAELVLPFPVAGHYRHLVDCQTDLAYGPLPYHRYDLYCGRATPAAAAAAAARRRPILVNYHGGAWQVGHKDRSALPLIYRMASLGWLCFNCDYRLSNNPEMGNARWPDHLDECQLALDHVIAQAAALGGDPACIVVCGQSAGAHLATLVALRDRTQRVTACVSYYGVYDLLHPINKRIFQRRVLFSEDEEPLRQASPQTLLEEHLLARPDRPPHFLLVQGTRDSLTPLYAHRRFLQVLRTWMDHRAKVDELEIDGAQHAFDSFGSLRAAAAILGTSCWLSYIHQQMTAPVSTDSSTETAPKTVVPLVPS
jgi:acetyl esterase/lipase